MAHTETCPICFGTGNTAKEMPPYEGTRLYCHGCGGKGWIEISDEPQQLEHWSGWISSQTYSEHS